MTDYCQNYTYVESEYTPLPNGGVLIEFYCGSGGSLEQDMAAYCPSGYICEDGACKPPTCTSACYWHGGEGSFTGGQAIRESKCTEYADAGIIKDEVYVFEMLQDGTNCCCYNDA